MPAVASQAQVTDPAAVEILWHPAKRRHLAPFLGRSAGLADAAALLGMKKPAMSYWIGRLLAAGLIRPAGTERLGKRTRTTYRCIADRLRVSLADAPLASHEAMFDDVDAHWRPQARHALARSAARQAPFLDLLVEAGPGGLATQLLPRGDAGAPPDDFIYYWGRLWLDAAERDALRADLDALWTRYTTLSDREHKPHAALVHLVSVPERGR